MNLFQSGNITLNSGIKSNFKIECDSLTENDIETIAERIAKKFIFDVIAWVPSGGKRVGRALNKYRRESTPDGSKQIILLVDDVLTTGNSMAHGRADINFKFNCNKVDILGVVIFARGVCPEWITPVFQMWE